MKKLLLAVLVMAVALSFAGHVEAKELRWVGCGIIRTAFMDELAAAYEKKTGTSILVRGGGATLGIRAVAAGHVDMGGTCRGKIDVPAEEATKLHHVAWDALVVIVEKDNPIENITVAQLKDVFTGKIKNWRDLGGADVPINLYVRPGGLSGTEFMFRKIVFGNPDQDFSPDAIIKRGTGPVERAIAKDLHGIGISGISSAKRRANLRVVKVDGVAPTKENIMTGKHPFFRPLYLTTKGEPVGEVKRFIDFALSYEGQSIISLQGTVNLEEGEALARKLGK